MLVLHYNFIMKAMKVCVSTYMDSFKQCFWFEGFCCKNNKKSTELATLNENTTLRGVSASLVFFFYYRCHVTNTVTQKETGAGRQNNSFGVNMELDLSWTLRHVIFHCMCIYCTRLGNIRAISCTVNKHGSLRLHKISLLYIFGSEVTQIIRPLRPARGSYMWRHLSSCYTLKTLFIVRDR